MIHAVRDSVYTVNLNPYLSTPEMMIFYFWNLSHFVFDISPPFSLLFSHCLMIWSYTMLLIKAYVWHDIPGIHFHTPLVHCTVLFCSVLFCTPPHCSALFCTPLHCFTLFYSTLLCSALYILSHPIKRIGTLHTSYTVNCVLSNFAQSNLHFFISSTLWCPRLLH